MCIRDRDNGVDSNSNGLFDTLNINVGVQVNGAGDYTLVGLSLIHISEPTRPY